MPSHPHHPSQLGVPSGNRRLLASALLLMGLGLPACEEETGASRARTGWPSANTQTTTYISSPMSYVFASNPELFTIPDMDSSTPWKTTKTWTGGYDGSWYSSAVIWEAIDNNRSTATEIANSNPAGIIINGDITLTSHWIERYYYDYIESAMASRAPVFPGLGARDYVWHMWSSDYLDHVRAGEAYDWLDAKVQTRIDGHYPYGKTGYGMSDDHYGGADGGLGYSWDWYGVHFVQLNHHPGQWSYAADYDSYWGINSSLALNWLESDLMAASIRGSRVFVLSWTEPYSDNYWAQKNGVRLYTILDRFNVAAVFTGGGYSQTYFGGLGAVAGSGVSQTQTTLQNSEATPVFHTSALYNGAWLDAEFGRYEFSVQPMTVDASRGYPDPANRFPPEFTARAQQEVASPITYPERDWHAIGSDTSTDGWGPVEWCPDDTYVYSWLDGSGTLTLICNEGGHSSNRGDFIGNGPTGTGNFPFRNGLSNYPCGDVVLCNNSGIEMGWMPIVGFSNNSNEYNDTGLLYGVLSDPDKAMVGMPFGSGTPPLIQRTDSGTYMCDPGFAVSGLQLRESAAGQITGMRMYCTPYDQWQDIVAW